jgi:hypothetical protein
MTGPVDFIQSLQLQFMAPEGAKRDPDGFLKLYTDALGEFTPKVLDEVLADLVQHQASNSFPTVRDCAARCREKRAALSPRKARKTRDQRVDVDMANRLVNHEMGRRAATGGWIVGLWGFCLVNGRRPNEHEADKIRAEAAECARNIAAQADTWAGRLMAEASATKAERLKQLVCAECLSDGSISEG